MVVASAGDDGGVLTKFGRHKLMVYPPSIWRPDKNCAKAPDLELVREHVYGMDGSKPGSVHFAGARCVYMAARLCVIEDLLAPQQNYFEGHNADVLCLSIASQLDLAISGQQEPPGAGSSYACVWCPGWPGRALCRLHCFLDRIGPLKGGEVPRQRMRNDGEVDFPSWVDLTTISEAQLRGISAVCLSASGRFAVMMAMDEKRSIILFRLPPCCSKPVTAEPTQTYVMRVPTLVLGGGCNIYEMAVTNPFDPDHFRFATLSKTAVKLWEYREATNELASNAVIFGKNPQQHLTNVCYGKEAGHLLMCGKEGQLYDVHGCHVLHSACLSNYLGCAKFLRIKGFGYDFLAADAGGCFMLGTFQEDPKAKPGKSRALGIRPQVAERFKLEDMKAKAGQEFPRGLKPKWRSLDVNEHGLVLAASEGHIFVIFDLGVKGSERCLLRVVQVGHKVEAWALAHHPSIPGLCASGDERGVVHFWDLEQKKPLLEKTYRSDQTVHRMEFSPEGDMLVLGQLGIVTLLEFPSLQSLHRRRVSFVKGVRGQEGEVISWIVFSNTVDSDQSRYLACACWDQHIYLFRIVWKSKWGHKGREERHREIHYRGALSGNSSSPTHVMFTNDAQFIVSNSSDLSVLVWRTGTGERLHSLAAVRDMCAIPWRNVLGWPVAGVWKTSYAQTDINAVCQSFAEGGGDVVAVGDDECMVNLYRFPAPISGSHGREYSGHASHVTNVQFNTSNVLVSLGGNDHTLMQWRLQQVVPFTFGSTVPLERQLPWALSSASTSARSARSARSSGSPQDKGDKDTSQRRGQDCSAASREVLEQLGRSKARARPKPPPLAPVAGYPGFLGPFQGDEPGQPAQPAASREVSLPSLPSSASRRSCSLPKMAVHQSLHSLTPAAQRCKRLASKP